MLVSDDKTARVTKTAISGGTVSDAAADEPIEPRPQFLILALETFQRRHHQPGLSSDDPRFPRLGEFIVVTGIGASSSLDDEWE